MKLKSIAAAVAAGKGALFPLLAVTGILATALSPVTVSGAEEEAEDEAVLVMPKEVKRLAPPATYRPKDNTVVIELCEYSGYAGFILANNGLAAKEDSFFFQNYGFKVELTLSDSEDLDPLNKGELAGFATTADVPALYGDDLYAVCPVLFGFSRGADHVVLRSQFQNLRDLRGETLVAAQHTESEFFLRYLCINNGLELNMRRGLGDPPVKDKINLVFATQVDYTTEIFEEDLISGTNQLAGCVGWSPSTSEVVQRSKGKAYINTTNLNQLLVADVLLLNRGFAEAYPDMVKGIVHGVVVGNHRMTEALRTGSETELELVAEALTTDPEDGWAAEDVADELGDCDLANFALNKAFLTDAMELGGSFSGIFEESIRCYGPETIRNPVPASAFAAPAFLLAVEQDHPAYTTMTANLEQRLAGPKPTRKLTVWKDVNFLFERNVFDRLEDDLGGNRDHFETISRFIRYSPGARLKLIGHLDDSEARRRGKVWAGEYAGMSRDASMRRALSAKNSLVERYGIDADQIEVSGMGWDQPKGLIPEDNRRVEVKIFTAN